MHVLKKFWTWLLGKTTVDETIQEKAALVKEELKEAIKEAGDVVKDAKGKKPTAKKKTTVKKSVAATDAPAKPAAKRRGRPKKKKD